jgi:hypothetical protein
MFDTTAEFHINARSATNEKSQLTLSWPTDAQWMERARLRKFMIKKSGRGSSETRLEPNLEGDLKLYESIKRNGAPPLTGAEASRVLDAISYCEIRDVQLPQDDASVTMAVPGGEVKHTLKAPNAEQVRSFRRAAYRLRDLPYNNQEMRIFIEPGAALWDECQGKSADYEGPVPAIHKDAAIRAVIDALDRELVAGPEDTDAF